MQHIAKRMLMVIFGSALFVHSAHFGHAQTTPATNLGPATVLSTVTGAPTFEIALPQVLNSDASIRLASPAAYAAKGLPYPLWLSDADMQIKRRTGQRQAISVQALRGNPSREAELLFEIDNNGRRYLASHTMLFDNLSTYAGQALPSEPAASAGTVLPAYSQAIQTTMPTDAKLANQPSSYSAASGRTYAQRPPAAKPRPANVKKSDVRKLDDASASQTALLTIPLTAASPASDASATPVVATQASGPAADVSAANIWPATQMPVQQAAPKVTPSGWLPKNWLNWALGFVLTLLVLYVLFRLIQAQRAKKPRNAPLLTQETQFQTSGRSAANTVFGLSDTEAVAMQQQWVQQQMGKKT